MKTLQTLIFTFLIAVYANAEKVEVYYCDSKNADIEWGEGGDEDNTTYLTLYRLGDKVGTVEVEDFTALFKEATEHDRSNDPFFGPGIEYLLKDSKGRFYIAYFEYLEGNKVFDGKRVAIGALRPIGNVPNVFEGSSHRGEAGTSFNKALLGQLKTLAIEKQNNKGCREG